MTTSKRKILSLVNLLRTYGNSRGLSFFELGIDAAQTLFGLSLLSEPTKDLSDDGHASQRGLANAGSRLGRWALHATPTSFCPNRLTL